MQNTTRELLKRPIAYQPILAKAFGSVKLAIIWCQLHYWSDKTTDPDGWVYKTRDEIFEETGVSRHSQQIARKIGVELGVLEEKRLGKEGTMHFRVIEERAGDIVEDFLNRHPADASRIGVRVSTTLFGRAVEPGEGTRVVKKRDTASIEWIRKVPEADVAELAKQYGVTREFVLARAEDVRDYCEAKGKKYSDYKAALRNFIKTHRAERGGKKPSNVIAPKEGKYGKYATTK